MTIQVSRNFAKNLAKGIAGLNILLLVTAVGLLLAVRKQMTVEPVEYIANTMFIIITVVVYSAIAVLIISRYPRHTVGWLFLLVGFFQVSNGLGFILEKSQEVLAYSEFILGLSSWFRELVVIKLAWLPAQLIPLTLVLQYFPDGRLPSRRWWPIPAATILLIVGWGSAETFNSAEAARFFERISFIMGVVSAVSVFGSLLAIVVRFRRSQGIERVQMKWLVYTALIGVSASLIMMLSGVEGFFVDAFFISLPTLLAITIGIAVLRYRLWDIDILIRRTLQYAVLTSLLGLIYFGSVVVGQSLVENLAGEQSPVVIVFSTLAIAALFNPLRTRIQDFIDRRFYRKKYDAEQTLDRFAVAARNEVDMDNLSGALLEVVEETMQPEQASLWLKDSRKT